MKIIRAEHMGMCFGVRDAIQLAETKAKQQPLTILGDLVHNKTVVNRLKEQGVQIEDDPAKVQTKVAMITAHGASERAISRAKAFGFELLEGTCPLVHFAHRAITQLVAEGYYPVVIGKPGHIEVRGLTEDLPEFSLVNEPGDVAKIPPRAKIGITSQTTQPIDRVLYFLDLIREQFHDSDVRFTDTVCQPTKQRQRSALDLARRCDVVLVIGGRESNNTKELVLSSRRCCSRVHHVERAEEIHAEWFQVGDTVGLTAGTSTPDCVIDGVEAALRELA